MYHNGLTSNN